MKLLLIEDDLKLVQFLTESMREHGFLVTNLSTKEEIIEIFDSPLKVDLIVLDRLLDGFHSKQFVGRMREKWPTAPIIVLSAISTPNERTELLNLGADDYLGKPFSTQELLARVRVQLRKASKPVGNYIQIGNVIIDSISHTIAVSEKAISLPKREFTLMRTLALDPSRVWSRDELLDYVWGQTTTVETNVVESTIANLRKKLSDIGANVSIRNLRNAGYWIAM